ncbi:G-type lectin S-receptor-like serine/threonine-protein kinase LECRK3 [Prunus yedoensis var. nudiflora]|uniref:G-type lectin S-receptor-like serine/threonine-protein kinase LECRK3 n=1 Tax=Prunus yedoensis var. nudiflora TaxID=2094558 RepID=A0A314Y2E9_PRUYE|nr:G-type lectin S-receptor-like serine/threonine-protein kinase LECRK3 [Prunus yedoensis var. nudiflora]
MQDFYQSATLEYDGVFRYYMYPKVLVEYTGGCVCGFNSLCRHDDEGPSCQCPYDYSYIDPNDVLKGCKQDFVSQSCDEASLETDSFYFQEMQNTDWSYSEYDHFQPVTEDWCRQSCLSDCFCAVAIFRKNECWKKRFPLSNGVIDPSVDGQALIKMRKDNSTLTPEGTDSEKKNTSTLILIGALLSSFGVYELS